MKRHCPGLYTEGDYAISRECECSSYCGGKWVQRKVIEWGEDGFPAVLGYLGLSAHSKRALLELIAEFDAR